MTLGIPANLELLDEGSSRLVENLLGDLGNDEELGEDGRGGVEGKEV